MITVPVTEYKADGTEVHSSFEMEEPEPIDMTGFWCECGNPSGDVHFHDDEFENGERVSKHHYTCVDCGRVTQVG